MLSFFQTGYLLLAQAVNVPADTTSTTSAGSDIFAFSLPKFIFAIVNFAILAALLYKFLHKPLLAVLAARQQRLKDAADEAVRKTDEADAVRREYDGKLDGLHQEREDLLTGARKEAEAARDALIAKARADAERQAANAQRDWQRRRHDALSELQDEILDVSLEIVRRVFRQLGDADFEDRMDERLLLQLKLLAERDDPNLRRELIGDGVPVRVISARELGDERRAELLGAIAEVTGTDDVELEYETRAEMIVGTRVEFSSLAVDASLADVLDAVREIADSESNDEPGDEHE
jgi:ATP synthase F0 subunit b